MTTRLFPIAAAILALATSQGCQQAQIPQIAASAIVQEAPKPVETRDSAMFIAPDQTPELRSFNLGKARRVCEAQRNTPGHLVTRIPLETPFPRGSASPLVLDQTPELRSFDLGKVLEGNDLRHIFSIRNTSLTPLKILAIKKSCGCETANLKEGTVVSPGELLEVDYALSKFGPGEKRGQLRIATDSEDLSLRTIELHLRGETQPKLWATPSELQFGTDDLSGPGQILRVESVVPGLLDTFQDVSTNRGNVVAHLEEKSADALTVRVKVAPDAPWGTTYDLIYLTFQNREHPSLNIRVRTKKGHSLAIIPPNLRLTPLKGSEPQSRKVRVLSPAGAAAGFRITRVECPENIVVSEVPTESRHTCDVKLTLHQPTLKPAEQAVVFHTDPPGAVTLTIRYTAAVLP